MRLWDAEKAERKADVSREEVVLYLPFRRGVRRLIFVSEDPKLPGDTGLTTVMGDTQTTV